MRINSILVAWFLLALSHTAYSREATELPQLSMNDLLRESPMVCASSQRMGEIVQLLAEKKFDTANVVRKKWIEGAYCRRAHIPFLLSGYDPIAQIELPRAYGQSTWIMIYEVEVPLTIMKKFIFTVSFYYLQVVTPNRNGYF